MAVAPWRTTGPAAAQSYGSRSRTAFERLTPGSHRRRRFTPSCSARPTKPPAGSVKMIRHHKYLSALAAGMLVAIATACGTGGGGSSAGGYHPRIKPAEFTANVENPWFPLQPGTTRIFTGTKDGKAARDVYRVTTDTKVIDGVPTRVV